jgi:hypothetical protein
MGIPPCVTSNYFFKGAKPTIKSFMRTTPYSVALYYSSTSSANRWVPPCQATVVPYPLIVLRATVTGGDESSRLTHSRSPWYNNIGNLCACIIAESWIYNQARVGDRMCVVDLDTADDGKDAGPQEAGVDNEVYHFFREMPPGNQKVYYSVFGIAVHSNSERM